MTTAEEMFNEKVMLYEDRLNKMGEGLDGNDLMALALAMNRTAAFFQGFAVYGTDVASISKFMDDVSDAIMGVIRRHKPELAR